MKKTVVFWLSLAFLVVPILTLQAQTGSEPPQGSRTQQQQQSPSAEAMLGDFVIVRPLSVIGCALGIVGTVATLPFSVPSGSTGTVARKLIAEPFAFTFTRPLGSFPGEGIPPSP